MAKAQKAVAAEVAAPVSRYRAVMDILIDTKERINKLLTSPEDEMHRIRIDNMLTGAGQHIGLLTSTGEMDQVQAPKLGPATTAGGVKIGQIAPVKRIDTEPKEDAIKVLTGKVEALYSEFLSIDNKEILLRYEDLVIRGVAKKAHLKVTKDDPETLTLEFIEQIKESILEIADIAEKQGLAPEDKDMVDLSDMGAEDDPEF